MQIMSKIVLHLSARIYLSGVSALWGPLHGGANQAVLEMLEEIHQNGGMPINIWQKPKIKTIL
jgi:citrate synthase